MQSRMIFAMIAAVCAVAVVATAQTQPTTPSIGRTDVCPPTGDAMGQSNYQRAPHNAQTEPTPPVIPVPMCAPPTPETAPATITPPESAPSEIGAGPELDATPAERHNIAVDDDYVYVLQGDEVIKLDKSDLHEVARTKLEQGVQSRPVTGRARRSWHSPSRKLDGRTSRLMGNRPAS